MNDAAVVAGLMARESVFGLDQNDRGARCEGHRGPQADDSAADDENVRCFQRFSLRNRT